MELCKTLNFQPPWRYPAPAFSIGAAVARISTLLFFFSTLSVFTAQGSVVLGFIGAEPDTPIPGEEDLVIYNNTGTSFGCSTVAGTPICTAVDFDNVVLIINGTTQFALGDIAPGLQESLALPGGIFLSGSITSLSVSASLSTTNLVSDLNTIYIVDAALSVSGIPVDGTLAAIDVPSTTITSPEPNSLWFGIPFLFCAAWLKRRHRLIV